MIPVVAAVIFQEGRVLICQRRAADAHGLQWEFPGGKVHPGESQAAALSRELREELAVEAAIGELLHQTRFTYGELQRTVELCFYRVYLAVGSVPQNLTFEKIVWEAPEGLPHYDFLPADREIVARIARGEISG